MKVSSAAPAAYMKQGNVSFAAARSAARAAKIARRGGDTTSPEETILWKRYLGHFGPPVRKGHSKLKKSVKKMARKSTAKRAKTASRKVNARKSALAKGGRKR